MNPSFAMEQFFALFERINGGLWPVHAAAYALAIAALVLVLTRRRAASAVVYAVLGVLWISSGLVFHWFGLRSLARSGRLLAVLFVLQGVILLAGAIRRRTVFRFDGSVYSWFGLLLVVFALVGYPVAGLLLRGTFLRAAWIGAFPCPVGVLTMGMLLMTERVTPRVVLVIPALWALLGIFPVLWGVADDVVLFAGGLLATGMILNRDLPARTTAAFAPGSSSS